MCGLDECNQKLRWAYVTRVTNVFTKGGLPRPRSLRRARPDGVDQVEDLSGQFFYTCDSFVYGCGRQNPRLAGFYESLQVFRWSYVDVVTLPLRLAA